MRETTKRLSEIDKQSSQANIGKVSEELAQLVAKLDSDYIKAPLEELVSKVSIIFI